MRIKHLLLSTLALFVCVAVAQAEVRIATVDVSKILNDSPEAIAKKKELDTLSEETRKKLESRAKDLQALKSKLESQKVSADSKEAESFRNQARDFERMRGDAKADLEKKFMKVNKELTDKVLARIEAYAKANGYDLVFEKSERFRGPVLFGSEETDITDQILKQSK